MTKENQSNPEELTRETLFHFLAAFIEENKLQVSHVAKAIGCSEASLSRIASKKTLPSDEMVKQSGILFAIGFDKYSTLTDAEKEQISEKIGAVGGGVVGFGSISGAVAVLGTGGLSGPGIVSGLAALGQVVGGGMLAGISVAAAIPIAVGAVGYGVVKSIKWYLTKTKNDEVAYDSRWEQPLEVEES